MSSWFKVQRDLQYHWLWQIKPFSKGQAWVDLILQANYEGKKFSLGGSIEEVTRGEFITSELKLMDRWGWSKSKVRRFLSVIEKELMIEKKTDRKKTTIKLVKYSVYQDKKTTKEPQKDHEETTERHKQERKNTKKEKKKDIYRDSILELLSYFKEKTGKEYDIDVDTGPVGHVRARFKDGKTLAQMKPVVDIKTKQWKGDPKWDRVLRLKTLFNKENFQEYYNESQSKTRGANQKPWHAPTNVGKSKEEIEIYERILKQEQEANEAEKLKEVKNDT